MCWYATATAETDLRCYGRKLYENTEREWLRESAAG